MASFFFRCLSIFLGVLTPVVLADEAPSAFSLDAKGAAGPGVAAKLTNAALNRISLGNQLMAVSRDNVQEGMVSLDLKTLFNDDQRRALASIAPAPGKPIPLALIFEALESPLAPKLDGVATKADLERIAGFSEEKDLPKGKGETFKVLAELKMAVRRSFPDYEHWLVSAPNGTVREYFFGADGKRLAGPPKGKAEGARTTIDRRIRELGRARAPGAQIRNWTKLADLARRADMGANAASDEDIRRFVAAEKKRRESEPTPTAVPPTPAVPTTPSAPATTPEAK